MAFINAASERKLPLKWDVIHTSPLSDSVVVTIVNTWPNVFLLCVMHFQELNGKRVAVTW